MADRKPYFFRYVYPTENSKWLKYQKESDIKAIMQFGKDIEELKKAENLTEEEQIFLNLYYSHLPLGIAPCTINRISWAIEDIFNDFKLQKPESFDYNLLKCDSVDYDLETSKKIADIYKNFTRERAELDKLNHSQKIDVSDYSQTLYELNERFERECIYICPSKKELCNILIDICYGKSTNSKRFVWDICGDVIINNLLERNNYELNVPVMDDSGDFTFGGNNFSLKKIKLEK